MATSTRLGRGLAVLAASAVLGACSGSGSPAASTPDPTTASGPTAAGGGSTGSTGSADGVTTAATGRSSATTDARTATLAAEATGVVMRQQGLVDRIQAGEDVPDDEIEAVATGDAAAAMKRLRQLPTASDLPPPDRPAAGIVLIDATVDLAPDGQTLSPEGRFIRTARDNDNAAVVACVAETSASGGPARRSASLFEVALGPDRVVRVVRATVAVGGLADGSPGLPFTTTAPHLGVACREDGRAVFTTVTASATPTAATTATTRAPTTTGPGAATDAAAERAAAVDTVLAVADLQRRVSAGETVPESEIADVALGTVAEALRRQIRAGATGGDDGVIVRAGILVLDHDAELVAAGRVLSPGGRLVEAIHARGRIAAIACITSTSPDRTIPGGYRSGPVVFELAARRDGRPRAMAITAEAEEVGALYGMRFASGDPAAGVTCSRDGVAEIVG